MPVEIKRPGSDVWESGEDLGGRVALADVVGSLVRYPTGGDPIVCRVAGLSEPDADGRRHLRLELNTPE